MLLTLSTADLIWLRAKAGESVPWSRFEVDMGVVGQVIVYPLLYRRIVKHITPAAVCGIPVSQFTTCVVDGYH